MYNLLLISYIIIYIKYIYFQNQPHVIKPKTDLEKFMVEGTFPTSTFDITEETDNWAHVSFAQTVRRIFCSFCM